MAAASLYDASLVFSVIAFIASIFSLVQTVHLSRMMTHRESWNPSEKVREPTWNTKEVKEEVVTWRQ